MTVETANYVNQFNTSYPRADDLISEGDDHIRMLKRVLMQTFPAITGPITISNAKLNALDSGFANESGTIVFNVPVKMAANKTINSGNNRILNTADPVDAQDVATKHYVDATFVPKTTTVNGHALSGNITVTSSDVGLSNIPNLVCTDAATANTIAKRNDTGRCQFVDVYITSDARLKSNLTPIEDPLLKLETLNGLNYDKRVNLDTTIRETGLIAQDVQKVLPNSVVEENGVLSVSHAGVIALLVEAVKELSAKVKALEEA